MVVYFHTAESAWKFNLISNNIEGSIFHFIAAWLDLGKIPVVMFFAISGFVIPFSLLRTQDRPLRNFAITRFFRLYPGYWFSMLLGIIFLYFWHGVPISSKQIVANITMLQELLGQKHILGLYWTLQIELIFYFIAAGMFWFGLLQRPDAVVKASLFFLGCALIFALTTTLVGKKMPTALPLSLSIMFWGLSWRYRQTDDSDPRVGPMSNWLTIAIIVFVPIVSWLGYNSERNIGDTWYRYTITYYTAIALFITLTTYVRITHRVFVWLGLISYSVYLMGPIAQTIVQTLIGPDLTRQMPFHVIIVLTMALTILISHFTHKYVEAPSQQFGRKLAGRKSPSPEPI